jgi:hypothetical protein
MNAVLRSIAQTKLRYTAQQRLRLVTRQMQAVCVVTFSRTLSKLQFTKDCRWNNINWWNYAVILNCLKRQIW